MKLKEALNLYKPFEIELEDKGKINGTQLSKYFDTENVDFILKEIPVDEIQVILFYEHKKTGKIIEINWYTMNNSEIAQEQNYKRFTNKTENSIFKRLKLKHTMPHEDKYDSYKYEVVGEKGKQ
jgi:hypothetical protein